MKEIEVQMRLGLNGFWNLEPHERADLLGWYYSRLPLAEGRDRVVMVKGAK